MRTGALICGTIPTVAAVLSLFYVGIRLGASISSSVLGALTFGLGTPAWIYSTMFWAHPLTTGCLATAFGLSIALTVSGSPKRDFILASSVGLAAGWAVATEYTAAGAAVLLAAFTLWHVHTDGRSRFLRVLGAIAAGALPPALILGAYHSAAFGSPFRVSYVSVVGFEGHQSGLYGFHLPPLSVILQLLFGSYRGLFVAAPVLAGGACTLAALILRPGHRAVAILAGAIFMSFLLFNASFYYWAAGWTVGPRYMAAGIPFLCVGLAPIVNDAGRVAKIGFAFLACTSIILMLAVLSTDAMPPDSVASPVWGLAVPTFLRGKFAQSLLGSPNLGQWIGLRGPGSLLPLLTIWLGLTVFWIRRDRLLANRAR
jgi:hypothetical protein